jgi:hypothetical protein
MNEPLTPRDGVIGARYTGPPFIGVLMAQCWHGVLVFHGLSAIVSGYVSPGQSASVCMYSCQEA